MENIQDMEKHGENMVKYGKNIEKYSLVWTT